MRARSAVGAPLLLIGLGCLWYGRANEAPIFFFGGVAAMAVVGWIAASRNLEDWLEGILGLDGGTDFEVDGDSSGFDGHTD